MLLEDLDFQAHMMAVISLCNLLRSIVLGNSLVYMQSTKTF